MEAIDVRDIRVRFVLRLNFGNLETLTHFVQYEYVTRTYEYHKYINN